jgi:succinate-acetate transporter protein
LIWPWTCFAGSTGKGLGLLVQKLFLIPRRGVFCTISTASARRRFLPFLLFFLLLIFLLLLAFSSASSSAAVSSAAGFRFFC